MVLDLVCQYLDPSWTQLLAKQKTVSLLTVPAHGRETQHWYVKQLCRPVQGVSCASATVKTSSVKGSQEVANAHDYNHSTSRWRHHCVDITGRIVLGDESAALRDLVCDLLSKGHKKILFNLGDVNYIDSSGLGHLVSAFTSVRKQEGELKLLNLTNKIHDLMQITRLYTVFDITDDEALAVKSVGQSAAAIG